MIGAFRRLDGGPRDRVPKYRHQDSSTSAPAKAIWDSPTEKTMNSESASARKTMIVTGGSQGIGAGLAKTFLDRGYTLVSTSSNVSRSSGFTPSDRLGVGLPKHHRICTAEKIVYVAKRQFGS